jgi:fibronectin-binding autotransporter adhesin
MPASMIHRASFRTMAMVALLSASLTSTICAQSRTWVGGVGDWYVDANWSPANPPGPGITTEISNGGTAQLASGATTGTFYLGRTTGTTGSLQINSGVGLSSADVWIGDAGTGNASITSSSWSNVNFEVGNVGTGTVNVNSGGSLISSGRGELGLQANSSGTVNVSGVGSSWALSSLSLSLDVGVRGAGNLLVQNGAVATSQLGRIGVFAGSIGTATIDAGRWTVKNTMSVGDSGNGTLTIQNGGTINVTSPAPSTSDAFIGRLANSVGEATVTGQNSTWLVGHSLFVGNSGTGTLHLDAGGLLSSPAGGSIGELAGSVGAVTVNGPSTWTTNGILNVGNFGKGTLSITGGGLVETTGTFLSASRIGRQPGSEGTVTIAGANSKWRHSDLLWVGSAGKATLTMNGGGTLVNVNDNDVEIGHNVGSDGTVNVGAGSTWVSNNAATLYIGNSGTGKLNLTGGTVQSNRAYIGNATGSTGTAVVGAGSTWTNSSELNVGYSGTGTLNVIGGGTVQNTTGYVAVSTGSTATVKVENAGSLWKNTSALNVGYVGTGTLNILSGGRVENTAAEIGFSSSSSGIVNVGGSGSLWKSTGDLTVGDIGTGAMNVSSGGAVENTRAYIGYFSGSPGPNVVNIDGTASKWTSSGELNVGNSGTGTLNITGGGMVQNTKGYLGRSGSSSNGTVKVDGAGSLWKNTDQLSVGEFGMGTLNILNGSHVENTIAYLGDFSGSTGTANVTGKGSLWKNTGKLEVGSLGAGTLNITAGGVVENTDGHIHRFTGSSNSVVNVDGKSDEKPSTWTNDGDLYVGDRGTGSGSLNVTGGAHVSNNTAYIGYLGATSIGTVTVADDGSQWQNSVALIVGNEGKGTFNLKHGAQVTNNTMDIGFNAGSQGDVTVQDTSSVMLNVRDVRVGGGGIGTLNVLAGGNVTQVERALSVLNNGQVNVTGPASSLTVLPSGDTTNAIDIGGGTGLGKLQVTAGGKVDGGLRPARIDGLQGTQITVDGSGSTWTRTSNMTVGRDAFGQLLITAGGAVAYTGTAFVGLAAGSNGEVTVSGAVAGSRSGWSIGDLQLGVAGTGRLNIASGASVINKSAVVGMLSAVTSDGVGIVSVDGQDSSWILTDALTVGDFGNGTLNITNRGFVSVSGDAEIGKNMGLGTKGIVTVNGNGTLLDVSRDLDIALKGTGTLQITGGGRVEDENGIIAGGAGSQGNVVVESGTWTNSGSLLVGLLGTGLLDVRATGSVAAGPDDAIIGPLGKVMGTGLINGNVVNNGTVAPGNSPGTLHIDGNYTQGATGHLQIELASATSSDLLDVTGQATLDGTLEIVLTDGFTPAASDTFNIFSGASLTGAFDNVIVTSTSGGGSFNIGVTPTGIALSNFQPAVGLPGDFNTDGLVDAPDYVVWRKNNGSQTDYNTWRSNFGRPAGSGSDSDVSIQAAVPEPASALLLIMGTAAASWRVRRITRVYHQVVSA